MGVLHRAVASLLVTGNELDPTRVSEALGALPTRSWRKGDDIRMRPDLPERLARYGHWRRDATPTEPEDLNAQVLELFDGLTLNLQVWRRVTAQFRTTIFCGWFMATGNEGVEIAADTLMLLGERGVQLDLDIYAPDDA